MGALLLSMVTSIIALLGGIFTIGKYHKTGILLGIADMALVILSARSFQALLVSSGKKLTPDWLGFGYNKPVLYVYAAFFLIGAVYVLAGAWRIKSRQESENCSIS